MDEFEDIVVTDEEHACELLDEFMSKIAVQLSEAEFAGFLNYMAETATTKMNESVEGLI